jgi:hypothetical protein
MCGKCNVNCTCLKGDRGPRGFQGHRGFVGPQGVNGINATPAVSLKISSLATEVGGIRVNTTISNGTAPFTYSWEWADNINSGFASATPWFAFIGSTTNNNVKFSSSPHTLAFNAGSGENIGSFGLLKCTVTDANGNSDSDTYLYININIV